MASFNLKDEADTSSQDIVLECCFCSHLFEDEFRHPRLLSCLHSICFQCLQGKINSNAKINCRFCKEEIDFSDKTIEQFPRDETKSNVVKLYKVKHSKYVLQCQECEDGQTSEFLCETCSKQLCKDCHEHHKRAKRSHILYSLQDMPLTFNSVKRFATTRKCQMKGHDEEILPFYCNSCKQTVCSRCTSTAHKEGHHVQDIHEVYETEIQKVKNEKTPLDELEIRIDNIINSVELEIVNVENTSVGILSQIEATYNKRVKILTRRQLELMKELEQEKSVKTKRLKGQLSQLKNQKSIVSSTKHFINLSLSTADSVSFIDASPLIIQKASSIRDTQIDMAPCEKPTFGFYETPLESTPLLGKMTSASIYGPKTIVTIPEENCLGEETEIKVDLFDYGGNVVNDEALDVSLQIYDTNNKLVHSISCYLTDGRTWFSKSILPAAGRYEIAVVVLGVRLDMETVNIEINDMQVLECAQIPVFLSQRMDNDRTIQITDIHTGLSDEDIIRYFQNNKQSGGGKIHKFSRVENDIFITFQDERVLNMASKSKLQLNFQIDVLKCCFCNTLFDEDIRYPRFLPCLHSICFQCLQAKIDSKSNIKCSFCEEETDFSNKIVEQFPRDGTKSGCLKLYKLKSSENFLQCQECEDEQTAEFLCETCSKQLCKDCYEHHKRAKRSHILYSLQDMPLTFDSVKKFSTARMCQMNGHDGEKLTFYCNSCKQTACCRCILIAHKEGHHVEELHKVYKTEVEKIEMKNLALVELENRIDNIVESAEFEIANVEKTSNKLISEIETAYEKQLANLLSRKNELMKELKQKCTLKTRLNGQILQLKRRKSIITGTQSSIQLALSTADSVSLIDTSSFIIQKASRINDTQIDMAPCEKPALEFFEVPLGSTPLLGKLISTSIYGPRTKVTLPKVGYVGEEMEIKVQLFDYDGNVVNDEELHVLLKIHASNNMVVDKISCQLTDKRTWSCKNIFHAEGRYEIKVTVLGVNLDMETVRIQIENLPVVESAQVPVCEFQRMNNNSTIQITNLVTGLSDEDIIHYFQNNKKSGGGKIHKFSRVENVVFITFQDESVLREVLTKRHHIQMKLLIVSQYNGPVLKVPDPIVLKNLDKTKMDFVQDSKCTRKYWKQNLENMFAKIVWPYETQTETIIYCMLTVDIPNCATLVEKWQQDIIGMVSRLTGQLLVKQMSVLPYLWKPFIAALQSISIANPETVSVVLRRESQSIHIVGYKNNVPKLETVVKNAYEKVKASYEKQWKNI